MNRTAVYKKLLTIFLALAVLLPVLSADAQGAAGISGCAYVDANGDFVCNDSEQLMSGLPVRLYVYTGSQWQQQASAETDAYGQYSFDGLEQGEYCVRSSTTAEGYAVLAVGETPRPAEGSADYESDVFTITGDESYQADVCLGQAAALDVTVYEDRNGDGKEGQYDEGVKGVLVEVLDGETVIASGETIKGGKLSFASLKPGEYALRFTVPEGFGFLVKGANFEKGDSIVEDSGSRTAVSDVFSFAGGEKVELGAGVRTVGTFSGRVFEDADNNGIMDETDPGVAGMQLRLEGKKNGQVFELTSSEDGTYFFDLLPADTYIFSATLPEGMMYARYSKEGGDLRSVFTGETLVREFAVNAKKPQKDKNIGVIQNGTISGTAFFDINYNGLHDEDEPGYANVTLEALKISNGDSMGKTTTNEEGTFSIQGLRSGDYRLRAILPEDGSTFTCLPEEGEGNRFAQNRSSRESSIEPLSVYSGGDVSVLVGVARGATVQGTLFEDANYNGVMDKGERTFSGVQVLLVDEAGNTVATTQSIAKGAYTLDGIMPGTYTLKVQRTKNNGFTRLRPAEEGGSYIRELIDGYGVSDSMEIAMAQQLTGINAGMLPAGTVSGFLFHDLNDNGVQDEGETGLTTAQVQLVSADGEINLVRPVAEDGAYLFDGVMPGDYTITFLLPEHTEIARVVQGGNTLENAGRETTTASFAVAMGEKVIRPLVGAVTLGSFEGVAFNDSNANGVMDDGEAALAGVQVSLTTGGESSEAVSAADGSFSLTDLRPGAYHMSLAMPEGYISSANVGQLVLLPAAAQTLDCPWEVLIGRENQLVGVVKPCTIAGEIRLDENNNGRAEDTERMMTGITLELTNQQTGEVQTVLSNEQGFMFDTVRPGEYTVRFALPEQAEPAKVVGSTFALAGTAMEQTGIVIAEAQRLDSLMTALVSRTSIGGTLSLTDAAGKQPVAGVMLTLLNAAGEAQATAVSDENGAYCFDGLWPGEYSIVAERAPGAIFVRPGDPNYPENASIIQTDDGQSGTIQLEMAKHRMTEDVLYIRTAKVGDTAWLDENANGLLDGDERRLSGVTVQLVQDGQVVYETTTDLFGYYLFDQVYPGSYVLKAAAYDALTITTPVPALRIISSCLTSGDGTAAQSDSFTVESGSVTNDFDLGYVLLPGQQLPDLPEAPGRDWSAWNAQYTSMQD